MSSFKFGLRILKHPFLIQKVACKGFAKENGRFWRIHPTYDVRRSLIVHIPELVPPSL